MGGGEGEFHCIPLMGEEIPMLSLLKAAVP